MPNNLNSKSFLQKVQYCIYEDDLTILEAIFAVQEKYDIHEDDVYEFLKLEKTLAKDLKSECIKNNMMRDVLKSFNIDVFF